VRVGDVLGELARFDATGFPADTVKFTGKQSRSVIALGSRGDTLARLDFAGDGTTWIARARGNVQLYDVASYRVDRVAPNREPKPPATADSGKTKPKPAKP
jgi:hypothetical protein